PINNCQLPILRRSVTKKRVRASHSCGQVARVPVMQARMTAFQSCGQGRSRSREGKHGCLPSSRLYGSWCYSCETLTCCGDGGSGMCSLREKPVFSNICRSSLNV